MRNKGTKSKLNIVALKITITWFDKKVYYRRLFLFAKNYHAGKTLSALSKLAGSNFIEVPPPIGTM